MNEKELELCSDVIKLFDSWQFTGQVPEMLKQTTKLRQFSRMVYEKDMALKKKQAEEVKVPEAEINGE